MPPLLFSVCIRHALPVFYAALVSRVVAAMTTLDGVYGFGRTAAEITPVMTSLAFFIWHFRFLTRPARAGLMGLVASLVCSAAGAYVPTRRKLHIAGHVPCLSTRGADFIALVRGLCFVHDLLLSLTQFPRKTDNRYPLVRFDAICFPAPLRGAPGVAGHVGGGQYALLSEKDEQLLHLVPVVFFLAGHGIPSFLRNRALSPQAANRQFHRP